MLFAERPYGAGLEFEYWGKRCFSCFQESPNLKRCNRCQEAKYCGKACLEKDWNTGQHQAECRAFVRCGNSEEKRNFLRKNTCLRVMARILARKTKDGGVNSPDELVDFPVENTNVRKLDDLMFHDERIELTCFEYFGSKSMQYVYHVFNSFYGKINLLKDVTLEDVRRMLGVYETNGIWVSSYNASNSPEYVGEGLFLQTSRFNHSCCPDLEWFHTNGNLIQIKPARPGVDMSGDLNRLHISYMHTFEEHGLTFTQVRRELLDNGFNFVCQCPFCTDEMRDKIQRLSIDQDCPNCGEALIVDPDNENDPLHQAECLRCDTLVSLPVETFRRSVALLRGLSKKLHAAETRKLFEQSPAENLKLARQYEEVLHPFKNLFLLQTREALVKDATGYFFVNSRTEGGLPALEGVLASYEFYGCRSWTFIVAAIRCAEIYKQLGFMDKARRWNRKARELWCFLISDDPSWEFLSQRSIEEFES